MSLSWAALSGSVVDGYEVMWERDTSRECLDVDEGSATITDGSTNYIITNLEEDSNYTVSVTAMNAAGSAVSDSVIGITEEAGKELNGMYKRCSQIISYYFPAPSAAPTSVSTFDVTNSSITVQWGLVDCIQRNGDITGYLVQYGVQESGSTQTMSVSGGATTEGTISDLNAATTYSIEVAAVNSVGTGVYSNLTTTTTLCKLLIRQHQFFQTIVVTYFKTYLLHNIILYILESITLHSGIIKEYTFI